MTAPRPGHLYGTPLSWAIVAVSFAAYVGLVFALGVTDVLPDLPLPWWALQGLPPVVYALAIAIVVRPRSAMRFLGGVLLLWAVHLLLGMLTAPIFVLAAAPSASMLAGVFPPSPLPQLLWVPVLLLPLQNLLRGGDARAPVSAAPAAQHRRPLPERRPAAFSAPTPPARPIADRSVEAPAPMPASLDDKSTPAPRSAAPTPSATTAPAAGRSAGPTPVTSMAPRFDPARRAASGSPPPGPTASEPVLQPAVEIDGLSGRPVTERRETAASRTQRLVDELLAKETSDEPMRVSAHRVLARLPAEALALSADALADETSRHAPLLVPRRLVLAQLIQGAVRVDWNVVAPQVAPHLLAMSHDEITARLTDGRCVLPLDEIVGQVPLEMFSPGGTAPDVASIEVFPAPFQPLSSVAATEPATPLAPVPSSASGAAAEPAARAGIDVASDGLPGAATTDAAPGADTLELVAAPPLDEPAPVAAAPDGRELARRLAAHLPRVGPLVIETGAVQGIALLTATSSALDRDIAMNTAALVLPVVAACRGPWPIDQVTLSGPRAAVILTPLGPLPDGGPVLTVAVPRGGSVALLELRCRQAAAEHRTHREAVGDDVVSVHDDRDEPDLLDVESSTRTREVASSLGALGTVTASTLRDADADRALYLFVPPGSDVRALGALAHDVSRVLGGTAAEETAFRTVVLRSGARRMVIRLSTASSGHAGTVVAAGETARPGLAYRQVERAAAALGAL